MNEFLWTILLRIFGVLSIIVGLSIPWQAYDKLGIVGLTWQPYTPDSYVFFFLMISAAVIPGLALLIAPPTKELLFSGGEEE
ncbi:MAG: hypothetical protein HYT50_00255 [Candidatus Wildermuthbacteria bacterium]|nr:hypothetical protein [Candidatus Wildermuthbacteria bacterium]